MSGAQAVQEQKKEQPAATMTEAGFSMNVKMLDPHGQEVLLTFRCPRASDSDKLINHYEHEVKQLIETGWQPIKAGARTGATNGAGADAGTPTCPVHGSRMKESRKPGSFYCPRKDGDNWCKEKVG